MQHPKLRIGILIKKFNQLQNWELRIIANIKKDPDIELVLLIRDGRIKEDHRAPKKKFKDFLFNKQVLFEENRYLNNNYIIDSSEIINFLNNTPTLEVNPRKDDGLDIFTEEEIKKVKENNLDIILKQGFNSLNREMLNAAKYGVWLLVHGGDSINIGPPGFWEILSKQAIVEVSLVEIREENNKGLIIDKAYYNRHKFSFVETNTKVLESSVSLLLKNLKKINNGNYSKPDTVIKYKSLNSTPNLKNTLKYSVCYFKSFFNGFLQKIYGNFGMRSNHWTLIIGNGNFMDSNLSMLKPMEVPKDEFWADPFLFKYKRQDYVFFENYSYKSKRGKISCSRVENGKLVDIVDVLDLDYHLSYPYIFEEDGDIFMMPETGENKRLEIYKCFRFPDKWELYTTAFEGENVADAFFYNDHLNQKWLFLNKVVAPNTDRTSELYIYKADSLKLNKLVPHKQNPVIIDSRVARNGGAIFSYEGCVFRPSQRNEDGIYGKALNINRIEKLTIDTYLEETVKIIRPNFQNKLKCIHHLHQIDNTFVVDAIVR